MWECLSHDQLTDLPFTFNAHCTNNTLSPYNEFLNFEEPTVIIKDAN